MPEPTPILYLADPENRIPLAMAPDLERQGFQLRPYQPGQAPGALFMIFSPVWDGLHYQSVEGVWARYLAMKFPDTKLVVVGSHPHTDPNYVDLFDLPNDWADFLGRVPFAPRFLKETPDFSGGMDMMERLLRFLKGHGNESLADVSKKLLFYLKPGVNAISLDKDGSIIREVVKDVSTGNAKSHWDTLHSRWLNYHSHFVFLPFQSIFEEIGTLIGQLGYVLEGHAPDEKSVKAWFEEVTPRLERLCDLLNELTTYVR